MKHLIALILLVNFVIFMLLPGCALFAPTPEAVKEGAELSAQFARINQENIVFLNAEWHATLIHVINTSEISREQKEILIAKADKLRDLVQKRAGLPAATGRELAEAVSAYLEEPGIGLDRILGLLEIAAQIAQ